MDHPMSTNRKGELNIVSYLKDNKSNIPSHKSTSKVRKKSEGQGMKLGDLSLIYLFREAKLQK